MKLALPLLLLSISLVSTCSAAGTTQQRPLAQSINAPATKRPTVRDDPLPRRVTFAPEVELHRPKDDFKIEYKKGRAKEDKHDPRRKRKSFKQMLKAAFKRCGAKLERIAKPITDPIDRGLQKLSDKEKKLNRYVKDKIKGGYRVVARQVSRAYMSLAVALEPLLGSRLVYRMDRLVGGQIVLGKLVGRFILDHQAEIIGLAVGLLISLTVSSGITALTLNPVIGGAVGGAVGAASGVVATHFMGAVVRGNLIPTSLHEAAVRGGHVIVETTLAAGLGAGVGSLTAGIGAGWGTITAAEKAAEGAAVGEIIAHTVGHVGHEIALHPVKEKIAERKEEHLKNDKRRAENVRH
jgi:hypothetical protein